MASAGTDTGDFYLAHEIQDILEAMDDMQIGQVLQSYSILDCEQRAGMTPEDVFNEVVYKALSTGARQWKKELAATTFFHMTGRSIISNEAVKQSRTVISSAVGTGLSDKEEPAEQQEIANAASHCSAEVVLEGSESDAVVPDLIGKVFDLFNQDDDALCFLKNKLEEIKKSNILEFCNFTDQVYRNVEKRVKDKVRKRFPNGLGWWEIES